MLLRAFDGGLEGFARAATQPQTAAALRLSILAALGVSLVNALFGTLLAWVLTTVVVAVVLAAAAGVHRTATVVDRYIASTNQVTWRSSCRAWSRPQLSNGSLR